MTKIRNTAEDYEDCIGVRDVDNAPGSLADFVGLDDVPKDEKEAWKELWIGMPKFDGRKKKPVRDLKFCFETEEDFDEFIKLIGYTTITKKTKTVWYPEVPREENGLMRFLDEGDL